MRIKKANAILKGPVNKLFPIEYAYHDTNQTDKAGQQKLRCEATVIGELKENMNVNCGNFRREEESLNITKINLLNRFNKTREMFPSVTRFLIILLKTAATSTSLERLNSKTI